MTLRNSLLDIVIALSAAGVFFFLWRLGQISPDIAQEDSLLEWSQAVILFSAVLVLLVRLAICRPGDRFFPFFFLLLTYITVLLREMDVEDYPLPDLLVFLGSGVGRDILLSAIWIAYLFLLFRKSSKVVVFARSFLRSRTGAYFIAGVVLYLAGLPFDKHFFPLSREADLLLEECFESLGTTFLFLATLWKWPVF